MIESTDTQRVKLGQPGARRERLQIALWVCLAPIAIYAPKGTVALLFLMVITAPDLRAAVTSLPRYASNRVVQSLAVFLLWALISTLWAVEPTATVGAVARFAVLSILGFLYVAAMVEARARGRRLITRGIAASAVVLAGLLAFDYLSGGALGSIVKGGDQSNLIFVGPGTAILALLIFPAAIVAAAAMRRPWLVPVCAAIVLPVLLPLPMFASLMAVAAGILVFAVTWYLRGRGLYAVIALVSALIVASPWVFKDIITLNSFGEKVIEIPTSWQHRFGIWEYVSRKAMERPVTGHGFDSSRALGRNPPKVKVIGPTSSWNEAALPLHPHSLGLQLWLELGAVGALLGLAVLWSIACAIVRLAADRSAMASMAAPLVAATVIASISFGAWQSWWVATLFLCAAAVTLALGADRRELHRA